MMWTIPSRFAPRCLGYGILAASLAGGLTLSAQNKPAAATAGANVPPEYKIGAGDLLEVDVWKEPEASTPSVVVRADGKITVPLVKEVQVAGLTPVEAEKVLTDRLVKFIPGAEVTVVVKEVNSKKVYLVGAVRREGSVKLEYPMTILQVLAESGGLTDFAKKKKIYVLRHQGGQEIRIPFNYSEVIKGEHMEQNIQVQPGDTIVVPQ